MINNSMFTTGKDDWETPQGFLTISIMSLTLPLTLAAPQKQRSVKNTTRRKMMDFQRVGKAKRFFATHHIQAASKTNGLENATKKHKSQTQRWLHCCHPELIRCGFTITF